MNIILLILITFQCGMTSQYKEMSYEEIVDKFEKFEKKHKTVFKLIQSFSDTDEDLPLVKCGNEDCKFFYAQITNNHHIHDKPAILLVGGFHGNERVGQNVITVLAEIILENLDKTPFKEFLEDRVILLMPMVNPSGYYYNIREEQQEPYRLIDINRDFTYDVDYSKECFQSKGARAIANIYKKYVILTGLTFHGGDNVVSWPWGSFNHLVSPVKAQKSPDETILHRIGSIMVDLALENKNFNIYRYNKGLMTDTVYPCNGAYEDWAYGSGWETNFVENNCVNVPQSFYQRLSGSPRNLIYLIEADFVKAPSSNTYGNQEVLDRLLEKWPPETFKNQELINQVQIYSRNYGHITRNILLTLGLVDLTQPYLIYQTNGFKIGGCSEVSEIQILNSDGKIIMNEQNQPGIWKNASYYVNMEEYLKNYKNQTYYINISCDNQDTKQDNPEPKLNSQSYLMQLRNNQSFVAQVGNHQVKPKLYFLFQSQESQKDGFKLVPEIQLKDLKEKNTQQENSIQEQSNEQIKQTKSLIQEYVKIILVFMVIIAALLSFIFYKYCNENLKEEGDEIQMVQTPHVEVHQDDNINVST